ncbi:GNAT family N-acetyltransferase [Aeromonas media]|uniref:GNAT family N-acetyltransferase n=1 Tax=Aeromonas media TaxID=651 RepID=UPI003D1B09D0
MFAPSLGVQLLENASDNSPLFQPIPKDHCKVSEQLRTKFRDGFGVSIGKPSWRKLWLAKNSSSHILGHIDLRHYSGEYNTHRVLLGMGVKNNARMQGLGIKLLESAFRFCQETDSIDWLDLNVLSNNIPAKSLYLRCGFKIIGEVSDFYRIDEESVSETTMTLCTKKHV